MQSRIVSIVFSCEQERSLDLLKLNSMRAKSGCSVCSLRSVVVVGLPNCSAKLL